MNTPELTALLDRLRAEPRESEWLEFKANRFEPRVLGEYVSALANSACLLGRSRAYLVFGIADGTHAVVGTRFDPAAETVKDKDGRGNQMLPLWLSRHLQPNLGYDIRPFEYQNQRVVLFEIHPAYDRPVEFDGTAYIRDGSSKTELSKYPQKARQIWNSRIDWSAEVCERATLDDLDPDAIAKARTEYKAKFPSKAAEVEGWDAITFLNKTKLASRSGLTHAALLLLGREESSTLLTPAACSSSSVAGFSHCRITTSPSRSGSR